MCCCWCYFIILLLVALLLFCYFLNPIYTSIVFYIFLPYSRREISNFFLIWYYILFMWLSIQFLIELWLLRLEQPVLPILFYTQFLYSFRVAAFALICCLSSSAAPLYPFLLTRYRWSNLLFWLPFPTFLSPIFQWDEHHCELHLYLIHSGFPEWFFFLLIFYFFNP